MDGNQPDLEFTVTGANPVSADTNVPTFASATLENTVANNGEYFNVNYVADGTGSRLKNVELFSRTQVRPNFIYGIWMMTVLPLP